MLEILPLSSSKILHSYSSFVPCKLLTRTFYHFLLIPSLSIACPIALVSQSCPTLCDSMGCSPPGSSVHGIFQAGILEWIAIPFSGGSLPRDRTWVSGIAGRLFTTVSCGEACPAGLHIFQTMEVECSEVTRTGVMFEPGSWPVVLTWECWLPELSVIGLPRAPLVS